MELPYFRLLPKSQQRAKPQFDRIPLCLQSGGSKYVVHQLVVNHDIGAHDVIDEISYTHYRPSDAPSQAKPRPWRNPRSRQPA